MKATGELIFVKNPDRKNRKGNVTEEGKVFCRWEGGDVLEMSAAVLAMEESEEFRRTGKHTYYVRCLNLTLRIICLSPSSGGSYCDSYFVMREGWKARAVAARYRAGLWILRRFVAAEWRVRRLFGQPVEGRVMPTAERLAGLILP